jgi:hypothetical protein
MTLIAERDFRSYSFLFHHTYGRTSLSRLIVPTKNRRRSRCGILVPRDLHRFIFDFVRRLLARQQMIAIMIITSRRKLVISTMPMIIGAVSRLFTSKELDCAWPFSKPSAHLLSFQSLGRRCFDLSSSRPITSSMEIPVLFSTSRAD